jgi:hypothetical protein
MFHLPEMVHNIKFNIIYIMRRLSCTGFMITKFNYCAQSEPVINISGAID